jgi:hypothetical protein
MVYAAAGVTFVHKEGGEPEVLAVVDSFDHLSNQGGRDKQEKGRSEPLWAGSGMEQEWSGGGCVIAPQVATVWHAQDVETGIVMV